MEHLSNDHKGYPNQHRNSHKLLEFIGKSIKTETTTWLEFPNGEKVIVEQMLASEERNKSKRTQGSCQTLKTLKSDQVALKTLKIKYFLMENLESLEMRVYYRETFQQCFQFSFLQYQI